MDAPRKDEIDHRRIEYAPFNFCHKKFLYPPLFPCAPLTWAALFKKDLYLNAYFIGYQPYNLIKLSALNLCEDDQHFFNKWRTETSETVPFYGNYGGGGRLFHSKAKYNSDDFDEEKFASLLNECISDSKLVWLLVDRFFDSELYISLPFISKVDFIDSLISIIGSRNSPKISVNVATTVGLITIGLLLIIMKMSSASLYNFNKEIYFNNQTSFDDVQYMLTHKPSENILKLLSKINNELENAVNYHTMFLELFQFRIMFSYFIFFDPENCECLKTPSSSIVGISTLLKYALHCSLNIDPDDLETTSISNKNLLRRLWYGLVSLDLLQCCWTGDRKFIDPNSYSTKLPELQNVSELEYIMNKSIVDHIQFHEKHVCPLLDLLLDTKNNPTVGEINSKFQSFKNNITDSLKSFDEITKSPHNTASNRFENLKAFSFLVYSYSLYFMVSYHFFVIYSTNDDFKTAFDYLCESIDCFQRIYELLLFIDSKNTKFNFQSTFGSGTLVFPIIDSALHKTYLVLFSILGRIRSKVLFESSKISQEETEIFDRIYCSIRKIVLHYLNEIYSKISSFYYHAWQVSKIDGFLLKYIMNDFASPVKTKPETKVIEYIKIHKDYDHGFKSIEIHQLNKIADKLVDIEKVCDFLDDPTESDHGSDSHSLKLFNHTSKTDTWLDNVVNSIPTIPDELSHGLPDYIETNAPKRLKVGQNRLKITAPIQQYPLSTPQTVSENAESVSGSEPVLGILEDDPFDLDFLLHDNSDLANLDEFFSNI